MNTDRKNEIIRRFYNGQSMRGIARDLHMSRKTVSRVLADHDRDRREGSSNCDLPPPRKKRPSCLDAHDETLREYLTRYPNITAVRLLEELRGRGYTGGYTILRERVNELRARPHRKLIQRFETAAGVQAQMDYALYTIDFTQEGRRRVNLFSYLLAYSRRQYLRFVESQDFETTVREHIRAFNHLDGVATTCLYDNMKVVVSRYSDGEPVYNRRFLAFATHYGFRPVACRPRRPQTKGKVERPFFYVETNLLNGRTFRSLEHLNGVTAWWLAEVADKRVHRQTQRRPIDLHGEEQPHLISLPETPYEVAEVVYRTVDVEGFIAYGQNRYSVPWQKAHPGLVLPVKVTDNEIIIYGPHIHEIARHPRFGPNVTGEKSQPKVHRPPRDMGQRRELLRERFRELGETALGFLDGLLKAQRNGWHQAQSVLALLTCYRRDDLLTALNRATRYGAFSRQAVERILAVKAQPKTSWDHLAEDAQRHLSPLLSDNPAPPRPTSAYQRLLFEESDSNEESKAPPQEPNYSENDGPKADSHNTDGHNTDGHKADGHKADGHKADGHKADSHKADSHNTAGPNTDHPKTDATEPDDPKPS